MKHRLAIVGASGHLGLVTNPLHAFPQVHLVAYAPSFVSEDVSALRGLGTGPRAYSDWRAMLDEEAPSMVVVCGRYDLNGPIAIEAARRGCHILSEKPAAHHLAEIEELAGLVRDHGLQYGSMLALRYQPAFYTARQVVRSGTIGEPLLVTAQKSYRWGASRPSWYADRSQYGSTMTWVGIHAFDYARWVTGIPYTEVYAHHANLAHPERPGCQDVATVIAQLANGGSATFNLDYMRPEAAHTHGDDRLRIAGSEGVLEVCDQGTRLSVITKDQHVEAWPLARVDRTLFGDFITAIEGGGSPLISAQEAFEVTRFAIKAAQSADSGQVIAISL